MADLSLNVNSKYMQNYNTSTPQQTVFSSGTTNPSLFDNKNQVQTNDQDLNNLMYGSIDTPAEVKTNADGTYRAGGKALNDDKNLAYEHKKLANNNGTLSFDGDKYSYSTHDKGVGHLRGKDAKKDDADYLTVTYDKESKKTTFDGGKNGDKNDLKDVGWKGTDEADSVDIKNVNGFNALAKGGDDKITITNSQNVFSDGGDGKNTTTATKVDSSIIFAGNKDAGSKATVEGDNNALYGGLKGGDTLGVKGNNNYIESYTGGNTVEFNGNSNFGTLLGSKRDNVNNENGRNTSYGRIFSDKSFENRADASDEIKTKFNNNQYEFFGSNGEYFNGFQQQQNNFYNNNNNFNNNNNGFNQMNQTLQRQQEQLKQFQQMQIATQALGNIGGMFGSMMFM